MESSTAVMNLAPAPLTPQTSQTPQTPQTPLSPGVEFHEAAVLHNPVNAETPSTPAAAPAEKPEGLKEQVLKHWIFGF